MIRFQYNTLKTDAVRLRGLFTVKVPAAKKGAYLYTSFDIAASMSCNVFLNRNSIE